jgi:glycyl-tRNA synthetase beta chain
MPELLLELLTEEIPARMQARAAEELRRLAVQRLAASGFAAVEAESFVTPRRLVLVVPDLPVAQADVTEERRGPRVGAPQNAIGGFLKSAGVTLDQCEERDTGKGVFYFATTRRAGRATLSILPELMHAILLDLPWPKSMRFPAAPFRWVRPLTSVLCLFGGEVVALNLGEVPVGDMTRGHRFLAPEPFAVRDFADYRAKLARAHVVLDWAERREAIEEQLRAGAERAGLALKEDHALLDEVTGLVEWPVVLMGSIDDEFMGLPPEVLTTSMRAHQKYFACLDRDGRLAPKFLLVANNVAKDGGHAIVAGNERVLRARLSDARFFWDQDRKVSLESRLPKLEERIFYQRLGTMADKAERIGRLAEEVGRLLSAGPIAASPQNAELLPELASRAGLLCKADLTASMVGEFPELQGIMGAYYAQHDGEVLSVAQAIRDHYSPVGPNDVCPNVEVSYCVALADKIDTLVGFFGIDEKPTGSKDPFALRRAALGVIRLILENELRLPLGDLFRAAHDGYAGALAIEANRVAADLLDFFADRLKVHLRERGVRHDLIAAVFAKDEDDLVRLVRRVGALDAFLKTEDGANLLTAYRRAANIVGIEEKRDGVVYEASPDAREFVRAEETMLAKRLDEAETQSRMKLDREDFVAAMAALARLRSPLDEFFSKTTVNDDRAALRANRLRLLARVRDGFDRIAVFSLIEG